RAKSWITRRKPLSRKAMLCGSRLRRRGGNVPAKINDEDFRMIQRFAGMPHRVESLERRLLLASVPISFGGSHYDSGFVSKVDGDGNVVVAGIFSLTANFDPSKSGQFLLTSVGETDAFVAKYSPTGALIWAD